MKLYDFQEECVEQLLKGFSKHQAQCLAWYTGAGKTNVFIEMCRELIRSNPDVRIGISAYMTIEIKEQVFARLQDFGLGARTHMIISGAPTDTSKNILVFNPQTIYRRELKTKFDYLIIDESHAGLEQGCVMIPKIIANTCDKKTKILLVSATPWDTLALKEFKGAPVFKRPLDAGLADGLITDFTFHAEEAQVTFTEKDFTRTGDLGKTASQRNRAILKSACIGKLEHLIDKYDKDLGGKVLVICPPGNYAEIAKTMADHFKGLTFLQADELETEGVNTHKTDPQKNLTRFKSDPDARFLFVVNKCQVGFDMQDLSAVVDMTMSRNIKVLAQRCGRVARKNGKQRKHYFYVYDQSLMKDRLEWLVATMIDFCLGAYDGWTTRTAKYRKTKLGQWSYREPFATTLSEVAAALRSDGLIHNMRTLAFATASGPPTVWTLERAKHEAAKWSSRTEMWEKQPALYKWFRLNAKDEMDRIFPLRNLQGKWNMEAVIAVMKKSSTRRDFGRRFSGAVDWMRVNLSADEREDLKQKHIGDSKSSKRWNTESIMKLILKLRTWGHVRRAYPGARDWMMRNQGERYWKEKWEKIHGKRYRPSAAKPVRVGL